ncbi:GNAT family N-acetyltransferase [Vibrio paucivorans]
MHDFSTFVFEQTPQPRIVVTLQDGDINLDGILEGVVEDIDQLFIHNPELRTVVVECDAPNVSQKLKAELPIFSGHELHKSAFYQSGFNWIKHKRSDLFPLVEVQSDARYRHHPLRPSMPEGTVYQRFDGQAELNVSFRVFDVNKDMERFTKWMNDPRVAHFWEQAWSQEKLLEFAQERLADSHIVPLIGEFNGQPFGYIEAYWVAEDRLSPYYDVAAFDRGIHLLVGEDAFRGPKFFNCWMRAISHYLFIDDARTQRIVLEPRHDNQRLFNRIVPMGYNKCFEFNFPHKRSALLMLERGAFFEEQW